MKSNKSYHLIFTNNNTKNLNPIFLKENGSKSAFIMTVQQKH